MANTARFIVYALNVRSVGRCLKVSLFTTLIATA